jgi:hypothetical protein
VKSPPEDCAKTAVETRTDSAKSEANIFLFIVVGTPEYYPHTRTITHGNQIVINEKMIDRTVNLP